MKKAIELNIGGIKCDNAECDFRDNNIQHKDYKKWLNKPCPKCGENLFTKADYRNTKFLVALVNVINFISIFTPKRFKEKQKIVEASVHMDGSGKMNFKIEE